MSCKVLKILLAPALHMLQDGDKAFAQVCEIVFHPGWDLLVVMAGYEAVRLQLAKLLGETGLGDLTNVPAQRSKAAYALKGDVIQAVRPGGGRKLPGVSDRSESLWAVL